MYREGRLRSATDFHCRNQGTVEIQEKGKAEFRKFVLNTYNAMIVKETIMDQGNIPSLALFCRFDIGLIEYHNLHCFIGGGAQP
ncbi:hypothetical protein SCP_0112050 [Sparassis crispa]|uniref:Uncharacterized protein n=1 Tax=Sparassis crispa TaxID=139825 RepID=A0A401G809_9APHY|nr:hypothetical protein SCP_0112050 [Sparassis crispa]GBE78320.1 hypothetical protein SCP_0112050 [Sparassis crispa]